ncbi:MAG: hypothetical protein AAF471_01110 [Myxococcota bacterium]
MEEIIERSGTPYFCFKDIDENKPAGSMKIRIKTIDYFLRRYREGLVDQSVDFPPMFEGLQAVGESYFAP